MVRRLIEVVQFPSSKVKLAEASNMRVPIVAGKMPGLSKKLRTSMKPNIWLKVYISQHSSQEPSLYCWGLWVTFPNSSTKSLNILVSFKYIHIQYIQIYFTYVVHVRVFEIKTFVACMTPTPQNKYHQSIWHPPPPHLPKGRSNGPASETHMSQRGFMGSQ